MNSKELYQSKSSTDSKTAEGTTKIVEMDKDLVALMSQVEQPPIGSLSFDSAAASGNYSRSASPPYSSQLIAEGDLKPSDFAHKWNPVAESSYSGEKDRIRICGNCQVTSTSYWRKNGTMDLCNACGLFLRTHSRHRPISLQRNRETRRTRDRDGSCQNCGTTETPLWRRTADGETVCNACGLYFRLHGVHRTAPSPKLSTNHQSNSRFSTFRNGQERRELCAATPYERMVGNGTMSMFTIQNSIDPKSPIGRPRTILPRYNQSIMPMYVGQSVWHLYQPAVGGGQFVRAPQVNPDQLNRMYQEQLLQQQHLMQRQVQAYYQQQHQFQEKGYQDGGDPSHIRHQQYASIDGWSQIKSAEAENAMQTDPFPEGNPEFLVKQVDRIYSSSAWTLPTPPTLWNTPRSVKTENSNWNDEQVEPKPDSPDQQQLNGFEM